MCINTPHAAAIAKFGPGVVRVGVAYFGGFFFCGLGLIAHECLKNLRPFLGVQYSKLCKAQEKSASVTKEKGEKKVPEESFFKGTRFSTPSGVKQEKILQLNVPHTLLSVMRRVHLVSLDLDRRAVHDHVHGALEHRVRLEADAQDGVGAPGHLSRVVLFLSLYPICSIRKLLVQVTASSAACFISSCLISAVILVRFFTSPPTMDLRPVPMSLKRLRVCTWRVQVDRHSQ